MHVYANECVCVCVRVCVKPKLSVSHLSVSTDLVDGGGAPLPIASILSPVLLAGGTCVDSYFSPQLVPVSDLSLTCHGMQTTVMYNTSSLPGTCTYTM